MGTAEIHYLSCAPPIGPGRHPIEVDGLMADGSSCFHSPDVVGSNTGGNTATMEVTVDQDATVTVTAEPSNARWSAVVSTGTD